MIPSSVVFLATLGRATLSGLRLWVGVKLVRNMRFSSVVFELDSQVIVNCANLRHSVNAFLQRSQ